MVRPFVGVKKIISSGFTDDESISFLPPSFSPAEGGLRFSNLRVEDSLPGFRGDATPPNPRGNAVPPTLRGGALPQNLRGEPGQLIPPVSLQSTAGRSLPAVEQLPRSQPAVEPLQKFVFFEKALSPDELKAQAETDRKLAAESNFREVVRFGRRG
jgi:hypothetical protein